MEKTQIEGVWENTRSYEEGINERLHNCTVHQYYYY